MDTNNFKCITIENEIRIRHSIQIFQFEETSAAITYMYVYINRKFILPQKIVGKANFNDIIYQW